MAYDCIGERLFFYLKGGFSDLSQPPAARASQTFNIPFRGALIYTSIYYDSTIRSVGDDHRKRSSRHRAPPIQSEVAGDYSQTFYLNLNLQSHTESCDKSQIIRRTPPINQMAS